MLSDNITVVGIPTLSHNSQLMILIEISTQKTECSLNASSTNRVKITQGCPLFL